MDNILLLLSPIFLDCGHEIDNSRLSKVNIQLDRVIKGLQLCFLLPLYCKR